MRPGSRGWRSLRRGLSEPNQHALLAKFLCEALTHPLASAIVSKDGGVCEPNREGGCTMRRTLLVAASMAALFALLLIIGMSVAACTVQVAPTPNVEELARALANVVGDANGRGGDVRRNFHRRQHSSHRDRGGPGRSCRTCGYLAGTGRRRRPRGAPAKCNPGSIAHGAGRSNRDHHGGADQDACSNLHTETLQHLHAGSHVCRPLPDCREPRTGQRLESGYTRLPAGGRGGRLGGVGAVPAWDDALAIRQRRDLRAPLC